MVDVIVVGAGAAGLMAARVLRNAGKRILVLEASDRIGGRMMTRADANAGIPVELGAEFIHGEAPITRKLLDEARLATVPVCGKHYRSDRGELSPQGSVWKRMSLVFRHLNPDRKRDRSFQEFLDDKPGGRALFRERQLAFGFVQGFFGADVSLISEKSIAVQGDPTEGASEAARPLNGYGPLVDHIARDVFDVIRTGARVRRIEWSASQVTVTAASGIEETARAVIIAVPLPILQDDTIRLDPEIPMLRKAARQLVMGHVAHVSVVVNERFWEKKLDDLAYLHSPERQFNVWWTQNPIKAPLLTGWAGGPPALALMQSGTAEDVAIAEMAQVFAIGRARVESLVEAVRFYDWSGDPDYRGAYSYAGVGGTFAPRTLARAFDNTIYIAGEATESGSSGTVEGALASGQRAALKFLEVSR